MAAYEIRLLVHGSGSGYRARWVETDGQKSEEFDLPLPLDAGDAEELRWYLEEYYAFVGAGTRKQAERVGSRLAKWGEALFGAVFGTEAGTHVNRNLRGGGGPGEGARADLAAAVLALAQAVYAKRTSGTGLPPEAAEALAAMSAQPPPLGDAGAFLSTVAAAGPRPPRPAGLPPELAGILEALAGALAGAPSG
jgi:hypothetical protein